ncbi:MAG: HAMP domain-containing sensor histidine kinase [Gemmataceae bacterium]
MRLGIRLQLWLPLTTLMLGALVMSAWTSLDSAARARERVVNDMDHIAETVAQVTFPRNPQTLKLMKGLSGAEFLLTDAQGIPSPDDLGRPLTTLRKLPTSLPETSDSLGKLGARVEVDEEFYYCRTLPLQHGLLYLFLPESIVREAVWGAIRPALIVGLIGSGVSILLALLVTQGIASRVLDLKRRTRQIADGDFSAMPLPRLEDEVRDLGASINEMATRLAKYQETIAATERFRLLGQVSGGLAHQLRNGVAGAKLSMQLMAREQGLSLDEGEPLGVALRQLQLVESQLRRFLDLGKSLSLERELIDLNQQLDDAIALLRPQCRHAGIDLRWALSNEPTVVLGDADQLSQLFVNVIGNAIEAAGPGGWVEVTLAKKDGQATIDVRDSGPGISPAVAPKLFEPFVTSKPEGVGLGLAVARQVAQAHQGNIELLPDDEATHFRVVIPLQSPASRGEP